MNLSIKNMKMPDLEHNFENQKEIKLNNFSNVTVLSKQTTAFKYFTISLK
jgi:hypothetical protein